MSRIGYKQSDEHKQKIGLANSILMKEKWQDAEFRKLRLEKHVELAKKLSRYNVGRIVSEETRNKISETKRKMNLRGENNPLWRGWRPKCSICDVVLASIYSKKCRKHSRPTGEKHPSWKGGEATIKERASMYSKRSQAKRKGADGFHTLQQWNNLKSKYGFMCLCCKKVEPEISLTEDHIIPINTWKSHIQFHPEIKYKCNDIENIQPLCKTCNSKKYIKVLDYRNLISNTSVGIFDD